MLTEEHILVLKGVYFNYERSDYDMIISDPNYAYKTVLADGDGYNGGEGFDNVLTAEDMLRYNRDMKVSAFYFVVGNGSIYDYWNVNYNN